MLRPADPLPAIFGQRGHIRDETDRQYEVAELHFAMQRAQMRHDPRATLDQQAVRRLVGRFFKLRLKLGGRRLMCNTHQELVDRRLISRRRRHHAPRRR